MKIQKFPEGISLKRCILWQYDRAERIKKLVSMFESMLNKASVDTWRILAKSLNLFNALKSTEWDNFGSFSQLDRAGGGNTISFRPRDVGMSQGYAIEYFTVRTRNDPSSDYPLQTGSFRAVILAHSDSIRTVITGEDNIIAISNAITVNDDDYDFDMKFIFPSAPSMDSDATYDIVFVEDSTSFPIATRDVGLRMGKDASSNLIYYGLNMHPLFNKSLWHPVMSFRSIDYEVREWEATALGVISSLFDIKNPGYSSEGSTSITIDIWRRYVQSRIYLMDCNGSCADLNSWLRIVFPDTDGYVVDNLDMTMDYIFPTGLTGDNLALSQIDGFFPSPAGVGANGESEIPDYVFGFDPEDEHSASEWDDGTHLPIANLNNSRFARTNTEEKS